ncbi:hypothetical protein A9F06_26145 [Klebsiella pneumoniae]|nr:hypothetical protein A9F06_26145 [Klebsiella pneumoniae]
MTLGTDCVVMTFFEQCPHRMACAKCSFYLPKSSSEAQYIEGRQNLLKMMQEIPLTDDEQAAVNNDIGTIDKLLEKLKNIETPDKQRR